MYHLIVMAAPVAAVATEASNTPYAIFASLVGLAIILAKVVDKFVDKLTKKEDEKATATIVQLDQDTLKIFHVMQDDIDRNKQILDEHIKEERIVVDLMRENTACLKDISRINERLVKHFDDRMDRMDDSIISIHDEVMKIKRVG
jgi:hypothetical protein